MELGSSPELVDKIIDVLIAPTLNIEDSDCGPLGDRDYKKLAESVVPFVLELAYLAFQAGVIHGCDPDDDREDDKNFEEWLKIYLNNNI